MFKNDMKNHYFTASNNVDVVVEVENDAYHRAKQDGVDIKDSCFRTGVHIDEVIRLIRKKRPSWSFKCRITSGWDACLRETRDIRKVFIYDGDDELGYVNYCRNNGWGELCYEFDNFRLYAKRQRGRANWTYKADKAAARIVKTFHSKTPRELLADAVGNLRSASYTYMNKHKRGYITAYSAIDSALEQYVLDNWSVVAPQLGTVAEGKDLPELKSIKKRAENLSAACTDEQGWVVIAQSTGRHIVKKDGEVTTCTEEQLPTRVKLGLGLLKMVEEGQSIDGIGTKSKNGNEFFIMEEENNETISNT